MSNVTVQREAGAQATGIKEIKVACSCDNSDHATLTFDSHDTFSDDNTFLVRLTSSAGQDSLILKKNDAMALAKGLVEYFSDDETPYPPAPDDTKVSLLLSRPEMAVLGAMMNHVETSNAFNKAVNGANGYITWTGSPAEHIYRIAGSLGLDLNEPYSNYRRSFNKEIGRSDD